jgi:rod shape-determining protein MreC
MDKRMGWGRVKPLVGVLLTLIVALSLPPLDVRRVRGAAAWAATPLWSAVAQLRESMGVEDALRERVRQLELERALLLRKLEESHALAQQGTQGLRVRVLAREPGAWERFLWVDAGRETHGEGSPLQKHSPVVCGDAVVGLIEYVGRRQSLVRLISDPQCCPAVQLSEEGPSGLLHAVRRLDLLLGASETVEHQLKRSLQQLLSQIPIPDHSGGSWKGILKGASSDRRVGQILKGDFFAAEWEHRQERSAKAPKAGHLLVTSGLDGLFPAGLRVGYLEAIQPPNGSQLMRGFTALPAVESLEDLQWLTILSPRGFAPQDRPGPIWQQHLNTTIETSHALRYSPCVRPSQYQAQCPKTSLAWSLAIPKPFGIGSRCAPGF